MYLQLMLSLLNCRALSSSVFFNSVTLATTRITLNPSFPCIFTSTFVPPNVNATIASNNQHSMFELFLNPEKLPHNPLSNLTWTGVLLDATGYSAGFFQSLACFLHSKGYNFVIFRVSGDVTRAGFDALFSWTSKDCCIPTYLIGDIETDGALSATNAQFLDQTILEVDFFNGPVFLITFTIPCVVSIAIVFVLSLKKLYRTGFPYIRHTGTYICILGFFFSVSIAFNLANITGCQPFMSWYGTQYLIIVNTTIPALMSFLISFQFHVSLRASEGDFNYLTSPVLILLTSLTVLHIIFFTTSCILSVSNLEFGLGLIVPWSMISTLFYLSFKLYISVYFFWAQ